MSLSVSGPVAFAEEVGCCEGVDGGSEPCEGLREDEDGIERRARIVDSTGRVSRDSGVREGGRLYGVDGCGVDILRSPGLG